MVEAEDVALAAVAARNRARDAVIASVMNDAHVVSQRLAAGEVVDLDPADAVGLAPEDETPRRAG